jgi:hypothetical protein
VNTHHTTPNDFSMTLSKSDSAFNQGDCGNLENQFNILAKDYGVHIIGSMFF